MKPFSEGKRTPDSDIPDEFWVKSGNNFYYNTYILMRGRCSNPNNKSYSRYGGRGIKVEGRWNNFYRFLRDVYPRTSGHSLDRIDNDRGYSAENCRWATHTEQMANKGNSRKVDGKCFAEIARGAGVSPKTIAYRAKKGLLGTDLQEGAHKHKLFGRYAGEVKPVIEWAREFGLDYRTVRSRLARGMDLVTALTHPVKMGSRNRGHPTNYWVFKGEVKPMREWAKIFGISTECLNYRLKVGWNIERIPTNSRRRKKEFIL